jgi:hypothetical protein
MLIIGLIVLLTGCTSQSTRLAITSYESSERHKQAAFDNSLRIANEQMHLNLQQFIKAHPEKAAEAIKATWAARNVLEDVRVQYIYGRTLTQLTVGQYLYDQQGAVNVLVEAHSRDLKIVTQSIDAGNKAAGITDYRQLLPVPAGVQPSSRPSFNDVLNRLKKK